MTNELPGKNELRINQAVMQKIVQDYLEGHGGELLAQATVDTVLPEGDIFVVQLSAKA